MDEKIGSINVGMAVRVVPHASAVVDRVTLTCHGLKLAYQHRGLYPWIVMALEVADDENKMAILCPIGDFVSDLAAKPTKNFDPTRLPPGPFEVDPNFVDRVKYCWPHFSAAMPIEFLQPWPSSEFPIRMDNYVEEWSDCSGKFKLMWGDRDIKTLLEVYADERRRGRA